MSNLTFDSAIRALKAAGEPTRLRLMHLCARGELTVSDLVAVLRQSQPRVSRHLKILCDAGLLERLPEGHWVYFRVPLFGPGADVARQVLAFVASDEPAWDQDERALQTLLGEEQDAAADPMLRRFNRLLLSQFLTRGVGDLLDVGVGSGAVLKLLAGHASHAVGIDTDSRLRREARRTLLRNRLENCTVRPGDMYAIDAPDASFDTVVLDEVLLQARDPEAALGEAVRVLRPTGQMLVVEHLSRDLVAEANRQLASLAQATRLRVGPIRRSADNQLEYLLAVATPLHGTPLQRPA